MARGRCGSGSGILLEFYWRSAGGLLEVCWRSAGGLLDVYWGLYWTCEGDLGQEGPKETTCGCRRC